MAYLLKHYLDEHPNSHSFVYFCVYCGKYFTDYVSLRLHKISHNHNTRKPVETKLLQKTNSKELSPRTHSKKIAEATTSRLSTKTSTPEMPAKKVSPLIKKRDMSPKGKSSTQSSTVDKSDTKCNAEKLTDTSGISNLSSKSGKQGPCPLSKKNVPQGPVNGKVQINAVQSSVEAMRQRPCPLSKKVQLQENTFKRPCPLSKKPNGLLANGLKPTDDLSLTHKIKSCRDFEVPLVKFTLNNSDTDLQNENNCAAQNGARKRKHDEPMNEKYSPEQPSKNVQTKNGDFPEIGKRIMKRRMTCQ